MAEMQEKIRCFNLCSLEQAAALKQEKKRQKAELEQMEVKFQDLSPKPTWPHRVA